MNIIPNGAPPFILFSIYFGGFAVIIALKTYSKFGAYNYPFEIDTVLTEENLITANETKYKKYAPFLAVLLIIRSLIENSIPSNKWVCFAVDFLYVSILVSVFVVFFKLMDMLTRYVAFTAQSILKMPPPQEEFESRNKLENTEKEE